MPDHGTLPGASGDSSSVAWEQLAATRVACLGEAVIDMFAMPVGATVRDARCFVPFHGGAPAIVAVALSRLDVNVGFIGRVGDDPFGRSLIERLTKEGVETSQLRWTSRSHSSLAFVTSAQRDQQDFTIYRGADTLLQREDIDQAYLMSAKIMSYGSVTLSGGARDAALHAARLAAQLGLIVAFDANLRPTLWEDVEAARSGIIEGISTATICKVNSAELAFLTGTSDPGQGSRRILDLGPSICLVTAGADGSYFNNGETEGRVSAFPVQVVDTTGCGDAFVAGVLCSLLDATCPIGKLDHRSLEGILTFANATAALAATSRGGMEALPRRAAVEALIAATCVAPTSRTESASDSREKNAAS